MRYVKKIFFFCLLFVLMITYVQASTNRLVIKLNDKQHYLYYDKDQINTDKFLDYHDLEPGVVHEEKLTVVNDTGLDDFQVFLRMHDPSVDEKEVDLLKNITITIYNGDEIVYTGSALGDTIIDNDKLSVLDRELPLGIFLKSDKTKDLRIVTYLNKEYDDTTNRSTAHIKWTFKGYSDTVMGMINPNTTDYVQRYAIVSIISFTLALMLIYLYLKKNKSENK